jgi:nickel-type superoxide dismutase maturation protease
VAWWLGRRRTFDVRGDSMRDALRPGDRVLVRPCALGDVPDGAVIVAACPERPGAWLVKRLTSRGSSGFAVGSDAPVGARDSRHFGSLQPEALVGRVTAVLTEEGELLSPPPLRP